MTTERERTSMASRECGRTAASFARPILRDACFGPLLPVAVKPDPLHFGVVLAIAMGIGLFAPPLRLGLYGTCLIGNVPIEQTACYRACSWSPSCLRSRRRCRGRSVTSA